ncbi:ZnF C2H2, partial [Geosmithia morbida]
DYSYAQTTVPHTSGMFCFSQTEPSTDLMNGSSWATSTEGPRNFPDFADSGSSHSGENDEFVVMSGSTTPRGSRLNRTRPNGSWTAAGLSQASVDGHAMSRIDSSRSSGSMLSHSSHSSNLDVAGNASAFRHGSHVTGTMVGADACLLMDPDTTSMSQVYWPTYGLDMENTPLSMPEASPMHVVPSQMQFGPDANLADNTSPGSWANFPVSVTRTSSPATIDETWIHGQGPISPPNSSPELHCQSPSSMDFGNQMNIHGEVNATGIPGLPEGLALASPMSNRRESESARNHDLYKNAKPQEDGLFHCPWEGSASCMHKPEKLKCNYDKYVDSHLKPYRCKDAMCEGAQFSSTACLLRHEREAHGLHGHGDKPFLCHYEGCERGVPGNGFPRQWNLKDHMKRVHNDHGSSGGSPANGLSQQPTKGRKRKTDVSENQAPTSRKASQKNMPVKEPRQTASNKPPLLEQWMASRSRVEEMVRGLSSPTDVRTIQQITDIQHQLAGLTQLAAELGPLGEHHANMMTTG